VHLLVLHDGEEVGSCSYDIRKLFSKKKYRYSTWLDLTYEEKIAGKLGLCLILELDLQKDIQADLLART